MVKTKVVFAILVILIFCVFSKAFAHMMWIERVEKDFIVFWGHKGESQPYNPDSIKQVSLFDKKGDILSFERKVQDKNLVLSSQKLPTAIVASMEGVNLVNTPDGRKRMNKKEAEAQGLKVLESFFVTQATKAIFGEGEVLAKPLGLRLEPIILEGPYGKEFVTVKVLYEGKAVEGIAINNHSHNEVGKTDSNGIAKLKVEDLKIKDNYYGLVLSYKVKSTEGDVDYLWMITSLTWQK